MRAASDRGASHSALVHHSTDELVARLVPYVRAGLSAGDTVHVNLRSHRLVALKRALGGDGSRVRWSDSMEWEPSPGRRLRAFEDLLDELRQNGTGRSRFVGECAWPAAPGPLAAEWERFDAVLDTVLAGSPVEMICTYDAASLPASIVERARLAHPLVGVDPVVPSEAHLDADALARLLAPGPLATPPTATVSVGPLDPPAARRFVARCLAGSALPPERLEDLLLVVTELVTNGWQAAASTVSVACWQARHGIVVQVDDDGNGLCGPFSGYRRPALDALGGRGLWIARQLSDAVEIAAAPVGTTVRAHLALADA